MLDLSLYNNIINITPFDEALQELDILFETKPTELIGQSSFGTNFEQFLWSTTSTSESLKRYIEEKISAYCYYFNQFKHDISIETYYDDDYSTMYVVKILLYKDNNSDPVERNFILKK